MSAFTEKQAARSFIDGRVGAEAEDIRYSFRLCKNPVKDTRSALVCLRAYVPEKLGPASLHFVKRGVAPVMLLRIPGDSLTPIRRGAKAIPEMENVQERERKPGTEIGI